MKLAKPAKWLTILEGKIKSRCDHGKYCKIKGIVVYRGRE